MRLLFRQRAFSWFDSYDIYDETGSTAFVVKGKLDWGHRLEIYDNMQNHLGTVREKVLTFLPRFEMYIGAQHIGNIQKELTFLTPKFTLDCNGWQVRGDIFAWNYEVDDPAGRPIMKAEKQLFRMTDTYVIDVVNPTNALLSLMIVLAIDAAKCSSNNG